MAQNSHLDDLIEAAKAFQGRKLWRRFTNFDCVAIRLPDQDAPIIASIMGHAGEQFGLMLLRGPHAVDSFVNLTSEEASDDVIEQVDMLSFSTARFGELSPQLQTFYRNAGVHPRHNDPVPDLLVKPPNRQPRLPTGPEISLLVKVVRAIVFADRRNLLEPAEVDAPAGVCTLRIEGEASSPSVSVERETLTIASTAAPPDIFAGSGLDLSGMKRIGATWLVATPSMPARIADDDRSLQMLVIAEAHSGLIVHATPFFAGETREAVDQLAQTFARKGMPARVIFANRALHDATAHAIEQAGSTVSYDPSDPRLEEVIGHFVDSFIHDSPLFHDDDDLELAVPEPDDLPGWKRADRALSMQFADNLASDDRLASSRAVKRYFHDDDLQYFFEEHEARGVTMAYSSWGMLSYRPTRKSKTRAEQWLAKGLPEAQAALLRARMNAHPTIYRVAGHDPDAGTVDCEDVLVGGKVTVHDQLLSENIDKGQLTVARAFPAGHFHFFELAGPPLGWGMAQDAVEYLRECGVRFTPEGLKEDAHKLGWLWGWIDDWQANWRPPKLCNTDGDAMLWHTASFTVEDPPAVRQALHHRDDVDQDEPVDEFVWIKEAGEGVEMLGGPVTLGRIELVGDEMILTVNSAERFAAARQWVDKLPGVKFIDVSTRELDPSQINRPMDEQMKDDEPAEMNPELIASVQHQLDQHYIDWLDRPLPALEGQTPREACRSSAGREKVVTLIRTMPDPVGKAPVTVPRDRMLRELGLAAGQENHAHRQMSSRSTVSKRNGKIGRNEPCPCGSGKKYKKCCGR